MKTKRKLRYIWVDCMRWHMFMFCQEASIPNVMVGWLFGLQIFFKSFQTLARLVPGSVQWRRLKAWRLKKWKRKAANQHPKTGTGTFDKCVCFFGWGLLNYANLLFFFKNNSLQFWLNLEIWSRTINSWVHITKARLQHWTIFP